MKSIVKILVSGPVGAGKTTLIRTLSTIPVVNTDELSTEQIGKSQTTVALDFGQMELGDFSLHLFGTPGQSRFDFMWEVLSEGAFGMLLLVACNRPEDFPNARRILEFVTSRHPIPFLIALTHGDVAADAWLPEDIAAYFGIPAGQVVSINPEVRESAELALIQLVRQLCI